MADLKKLGLMVAVNCTTIIDTKTPEDEFTITGVEYSEEPELLEIHTSRGSVHKTVELTRTTIYNLKFDDSEGIVKLKLKVGESVTTLKDLTIF